MDPAFQVTLRHPATMEGDDAWAFAILPKAQSDRFARRGRTTAQGKLNGYPFQATLEPDGQLSHWLKFPAALLQAAGVKAGLSVTLELAPAAELEPQLPSELRALLDASPQAKASWDGTTTIARIDWIHWIESAKQAKTRNSRIADACDMLASGKKRVCCFDASGYYSKSMQPPRAAD